MELLKTMLRENGKVEDDNSRHFHNYKLAEGKFKESYNWGFIPILPLGTKEAFIIRLLL